MSRLSIEISERQHQKIKALAALSGKSIKEYILEKTLLEKAPVSAAMTKKHVAAKPEALHTSRVQTAEDGNFSSLNLQKLLGKARS